jgi:hypothetical protein
MTFNFDKFEKIKDRFAETLKVQMQTRCFNQMAPSFDVTVDIHGRYRGNGKKIEVVTSDLTERMNFNMFEEICLVDFGGNVMTGENDDLYWMPIYWSYQNKSGGGNGCEAFTVYFNDSGEIKQVRAA